MRRLKDVQSDLSRQGFAELGEVLDAATLASVNAAYFEQFGGLSEEELAQWGRRVGDERWMLSLKLESPFAEIAESEALKPILAGLFGEDYRLDSFTCVVSYPGAPAQHPHVDAPLLFEDQKLSGKLPCYATSLVVPLVDQTERTGGTVVWPGSHRKLPGAVKTLFGGTPIRVKAGHGYLMDYRCVHGGEPNASALPRPVLYIVFARSWFTDSANFHEHPALRT